MTEKNEEKEIDNKDSQGGGQTKNNSPEEEKKSHKTADIKKFADAYYKTERRFSDTEPLADHIGQKLIINGHDMGQGAHGPFIILDASVNGEDKRLRSSSKIVIERVLGVKDDYPVEATVISRVSANGYSYHILS